MFSYLLPFRLRSLRAKVLLTIVTALGLLALAAVWRITYVYGSKLEQELASRAHTLANAVSYQAATADSPQELQRFVTAVSDAPEVTRVVVVSTDPDQLIADSTPQQHIDEATLAALFDAARHSADSSSVNWRTHRFHWYAPTMVATPEGTGASLSKGAVLVQYTTHGIQAELGVVRMRIPIAMVCLVLLTSAVTYAVLQRWVLRPAHDLVDVILRRAAGQSEAFTLVHSDDELGRVASALNAMLDALDRKETERQRALLSLSASEALAQKLSMVASRTDNGVVITDPQGRIDWINDGFTRMTGYTLDEVRGQKPGDVLQGPASNEVTVLFMRERLAAGESFATEIVNYHKSGTPYWVNIEVQPIHNDVGEITHFMAIQRDITAQREAQSEQQKFVSLVENAGDFIAMTTLEGQFTYVNPAGCRLVGMTGLGQAVRTELGGLVPSEGVEFLHSQVIGTALAANQWTGELIFRHLQSGNRIDVQATVFVIRDPRNGHSICLAIVARDVTERKRAESRLVRSHQEIAAARVLLEHQTQALQRQNEELQQAREKAEAAAQAKNAFLANMSHEIRTPMSAILGYAEMLSSSVQRPEEVDAVNVIQRHGEHLLAIINDILDLSKIEADRMHTEHLPVDPREVLHDVLSLMRVRVQAKQLECSAHIASDVPARVMTDPTRLRQILINLLGNAIKFTEHGSVTMELSIDRTNPAMPQLYFDVRDTGIGLNPEQIATLFQPFVQADNSMTRRFGGTGLGLTISQRFAQMLGGSITVTSALGEGSTFRVSIACQEPSTTATCNAAPVPTPAATPIATAPPSSLVGKSLLVAEDGPENQRIIALLLRKAGATVTVVENGQLAIEAAQTDTFDAILLDMQMPVMDGYDAAAALRAQGYTGPIVALTALAMEGDREKCLAAGCDDYATKPLQRQTLLTLLEAQLARAASSPAQA